MCRLFLRMVYRLPVALRQGVICLYSFFPWLMCSICRPDGSELPVYFQVTMRTHELSFLWEHWFVHKNTYVCEQGENHFLLGFVCPVLLYVQVTPVCAPSLCAHVCCSLFSFICISHVYVFLCAFVYVPMCDAGNCVWIYLWSEHKCTCVYMHLFHLLDLMFLLDVRKYVFVVGCHVQLDDIDPTCPCIFFSPSLMNLFLPLPGEKSCALRDSLEWYYLVPYV